MPVAPPTVVIQISGGQNPPSPLLIEQHIEAFTAKHQDIHQIAPSKFTLKLAIVLLGIIDSRIKHQHQTVIQIDVAAEVKKIWDDFGQSEFQVGWRQTLFEVIKEQHKGAICSCEGKPITHMSSFTVDLSS